MRNFLLGLGVNKPEDLHQSIGEAMELIIDEIIQSYEDDFKLNCEVVRLTKDQHEEICWDEEMK